MHYSRSFSVLIFSVLIFLSIPESVLSPLFWDYSFWSPSFGVVLPEVVPYMDLIGLLLIGVFVAAFSRIVRYFSDLFRVEFSDCLFVSFASFVVVLIFSTVGPGALALVPLVVLLLPFDFTVWSSFLFINSLVLLFFLVFWPLFPLSLLIISTSLVLFIVFFLFNLFFIVDYVSNIAA